MAHPEYQYLKLMAEIIKDGRTKQTRGIHPVIASSVPRCALTCAKAFLC
jgi:hypothetical protein